MKNINTHQEHYQYTGAYKEYYTYHREETLPSDTRLDVIPREYIEGKRVLDLGCNDGTFTIQLFEKYKPSFVLGIDSSTELIKRAEEQLQKKGWKSDKQQLSTLLNFDKKLPPSLRAHTSISLEEKPTICFASMDILDVEAHEFFDVVLMFSVSKWLHVKRGDKGLLKAFGVACDSLSPGGLLIAEWQPWRSYNKLKSREDRIATRKLSIHPADFDDILSYEFTHILHKYPTTLSGEQGKSKRAIDIYMKKPSVAFDSTEGKMM